MKKKITYKRNNQNVTSVNIFYLVGPLAFANHSCSTHLNAITVDEKLKNISLVRVREKNQQITYDYGYKNDYCNYKVYYAYFYSDDIKNRKH
jgi:hypothetical protein